MYFVKSLFLFLNVLLCFIEPNICLYLINTEIFFISERFYFYFDRYLTFLNVFFRFDIEKIRFISFILEELRSISKKNVQYRSIFIPKKVFLKQGQLPINLFRFVFVLLFKEKQRFI